MRRPSLLLRLLPLAMALAACAQLKDPNAAITTEGPHSVLVGQTVQITATTRGATDDSYQFESEDLQVAAVDATGQVTGVRAGETQIKVTGPQSGLEARHVIVVIDPTAGVDAGVDPRQVPFYVAWSGSPHADKTAEAFSRWNAEGSVPTTCARCHSSEGYIDYLGGDGTAPGRVDSPGRIESVVRCETCHNSAAASLTSVTFPSGKTVNGLGAEARCMVCHQGRASGQSVDAQIADAGVGEDSTSPLLGFTNVHYYPAAATLFAAQAAGGYQYAGQVYDTRFRHVPSFDKCNECHDPHSTRVRWDACATCHPGVTDVTQAWNIRQIASRNQDYDGDNNRAEGIYFEIQGLRERLLAAIQRYGTERAQPICYGNANPYWFKDNDGDGACSQAESVSTNRYASWTPRLQKAAYNYQLSKVDPGAFAHNAKYIIQLLHDSAQSVNAGLSVPFDNSLLVRNDPGHFNGASKAARNWDSSETVSASCSRCHSGAQGYRFFVQYGVGQSVPETDNGLECFTCHENFEPTYDVFLPTRTWLPDGRTTVSLPGQDNLCANCHIGRTSKANIDAVLAAGGTLRFQNVHYMPAAGTREGTLAKIGYEYAGKTYAGRLTHTGGVQCASCHDPVLSNHTFRVADVWNGRCETCHADQSAADQIRLVHTQDYDGDGNTTESLRAEVDGMAARLLTAMRAVTGNGICYQGDVNPYFFKDTDQNGACSATEAVSSNAFAPFTPALVKATHNYQLSKKDPGAWAHNFNYIGQLLFDSTEDVSGAPPANMIRP